MYILLISSCLAFPSLCRLLVEQLPKHVLYKQVPPLSKTDGKKVLYIFMDFMKNINYIPLSLDGLALGKRDTCSFQPTLTLMPTLMLHVLLSLTMQYSIL